MEEEEEEYDPYRHRQQFLSDPQNTTDNLTSCCHLLGRNFVLGFLAMPHAFKHAGMINGIFSMAILTIITTYCIHVLVRSQYVLCKKKRVGLLNYAESMKAAAEFGPPALRKCGKLLAFLADFFMLFYQFGVCCVYFLFIGRHLKSITDEYTSEKQPLYYFMLGLLIPFCLLMCLRKMKLGPALAVFLQLLIISMIISVLFRIFRTPYVNFNDLPGVGPIEEYPLFVGTALVSLQPIPLVMAIENNMEKPVFFLHPIGALNAALFILAPSHLLLGIFGYWRFGEEIQPSVTMNFAPDQISNQVYIAIYILLILIIYGLDAQAPIHYICTSYLYPKLPQETTEKKKIIFEMIIRFGFVIVTCGIGTAIPFMGILVPLCGIMSLTTLGFIFPGLLEICAHWEEGKSRANKFTFWKDLGIIILGFAGWSTGLYSAIRAMIEKFSSGDY